MRVPGIVFVSARLRQLLPATMKGQTPLTCAGRMNASMHPASIPVLGFIKLAELLTVDPATDGLVVSSSPGIAPGGIRQTRAQTARNHGVRVADLVYARHHLSVVRQTPTWLCHESD